MMHNLNDYEQIKYLLEKLKNNRDLQFEEFKVLLESTYDLLQLDIENNEKDWYNLSLSVICHVAEYLPEDSLLRELLLECISASRIFLYRDMLEEIESEFSNYHSSVYEDFARNFYTLDTGTTLTKDQKSVFNAFQKFRRIIVSAPTSFGKTKIITEIINHNDYENIGIVLPTIALLTETFIRFRKNSEISNKYNLVNSLKQPIKDKNNILIFTPEKIDLFMDENPNFNVDFFVMDEIYKIQDDGDRSKIFTNCLYRLSKTKADFYLIGPYFGKFSPAFLEKTNSNFLKFDSEIVQKDYIDMTTFEAKEKVSIGKNIQIINRKADTNLKNIIKNTSEQALVYVGNKRGVESKAKRIADQLPQLADKSELVDYLETTFSKDWSLVYCLKKGVAFHHAGIPKFIQTEIIDSFNNGQIKVIVCSPTIIEGVNTAAKQVIIYDAAKGNDPLTDFDVKNIYGRAGRFMQHFIGRSIALTCLPQSQEEKAIEFTLYDNDLDDEELVQVDKEDLKQQNLIKRNALEEALKNQNIPLEIVQKNKFIPIENQIFLINSLREQLFFYDEFEFTNQPTKEQFEKIIRTIQFFLFTKKYKEDKSCSLHDLIFNAKGYVYLNLSLKQFIEQQNRVTIDAKIRCALNLITNYFEFALPKYLLTFQNLFNFVCAEKGLEDKKIKLDLLIMKLEYGVTEPHEIALKEAGIPIQIIRNINEVFKGCADINEIREKFFNNKKIIGKLHPYEQKIFEKHI